MSDSKPETTLYELVGPDGKGTPEDKLRTRHNPAAMVGGVLVWRSDDAVVLDIRGRGRNSC